MVFHILFLLLLPHCCEGVPQVIGSSQPIVANIGDDVILPCHLKPALNAATQTVEWTRQDLEPRFVYLWRSGEELLGDQHPSYVRRTSLFINELKNGNVSLKLSRVKLSDRGTYRCFLPNIDRDTNVELLLVELFMDQASSAVRITVFVAVCIIPVVAVVLVVMKWGQNQKTKSERGAWKTFGTSLELGPLMVGDGEQSMTVNERIKYLDNTKVKLEEELERNEGELDHVQQVIKTLMEQKNDLKTQREKLISLQKDDKVKIEENKKKLANPPKTGIQDKMKKRKHTEEELAKRKKEHNELLQNVEKLLESTDDMINKMNQRKGKLENDKEQFNKYLKETKRQIDGSQRDKSQRDKSQGDKSQTDQSQTDQSQRQLELLEREQAEVEVQSEQAEDDKLNPFGSA